MMQTLLGTICICFLLACLPAGRESQPKAESLSCGAVDRLMQQYSQEDFSQVEAPLIASGWMMPLPSGKEVQRSLLQAAAQPLVEGGREAVPCLIPWVRSEPLFLRYIAIFALQQITGLTPHTPYFDAEDRENRREAAIAVWQKWHEETKDKP
jgi:hypothetical protein